jgi:hypothetical protein
MRFLISEVIKMTTKQLDIVTMQSEKVRGPRMHTCLLIFATEDRRIEYVEWPLPIYRVTGIDPRWSHPTGDLQRDNSGREVLYIYPVLESTKTYKEIIDRFFTPRNSAGHRLQLCDIPSVDLIDVFMPHNGRIIQLQPRKLQYVDPDRGGWIGLDVDRAVTCFNDAALIE